MRGEDYAVFAIRNIIGQDVHELVAGQYVQTAGRLVENQQFRIVAQRHGEHELHLHAARQVLDLLVPSESEPSEVCVEQIVVPQRVHWAACPFHRVDRHVFDEIAAVEHYAQLLFGPLLIGHRVKAEHFDSSRVSRGHIEDQFDQRGFAGAVRTDQTHDVAGRQVEGHVIQCEAGIIMLRQSGYAQGQGWPCSLGE